jgi:hypothetical protein
VVGDGEHQQREYDGDSQDKGLSWI